MWYVVPFIRSQLAIFLVNDLGFKQAEAARKLGLTDAAVSQYLSKKRANAKIDQKKIVTEIKKSAMKISKCEGIEVVADEICRLCRAITEAGLAEQLQKEGCEQCP
jgi:predicted transcriptional regulator